MQILYLADYSLSVHLSSLYRYKEEKASICNLLLETLSQYKWQTIWMTSIAKDFFNIFALIPLHKH